MATTTSARYNLVSALFAFVIWGSWAYYINHDHGWQRGLISAFAQGSLSFCMTLLVVRVVTWLYHRMPHAPLREWLSAGMTASVAASCLALTHYVVGTPNIVRTIAPGLTVAFSFGVVTAYKLR